VSLSEMQTLFLWALLARGGSAEKVADVKVKIAKRERDALIAGGLIEVERRGRAVGLAVSEKGWAWANDNLAHALPARSTAGAAVLHGWLAHLQAFMQAKGLRLADILGGQASASSGSPGKAAQSDGHAALRERIRAAYLDVTGGTFNRRALLSNVRRRLGDVDRADLDEALKRMQRDEEASLMRLDNPIDIAEADREAAVQIGEEPRHILWISR